VKPVVAPTGATTPSPQINFNMKTKHTLAALALLAVIGLFFLKGWNNPPASAPLINAAPAPAAAAAAANTPTTAASWKDDVTAPAVASSLYHTAPEAAALQFADTRFETANRFQFPALLAELERMPDSPVKDDMMREALTKWAALDGDAAANWAKLRAAHRHFLPDILQAWAATGAKAAASAWAFAKTALAADGDTTSWLAPGFVKAAFGGMAATTGDGWWNELAGLSGTPMVQGMFGAAEFASNRQVNTEFTAAMQGRILDSGSAPLAAAFYAGAGHITAAKEELASVTDAAQWHAIAREVARQQAEFEPGKAMDWLASQFAQPSDAIEDMVNSVGQLDDVSAQGVLTWLRNLPASDARTAGIEQVQQAFPQLRPDLAVEVISLE
jgi:hypothetical protein